MIVLRDILKRESFLVILLGVLLAVTGYQFLERQPAYPEAVRVGGEWFALEIADTVEKQELGLGEREELCDHCAMLFPFGTAGRHDFWMKGMRFPLDIVWLQGERVAHIERRIPQESTEIYHGAIDADQVLEFNAGAVEGLQVGDRVVFSGK